MVSGQGGSSEGEAATGLSTSLSFVPSLLANAFFGTGIGLDQGGFFTTGTGDFTPGGSLVGSPGAGGAASSIVDPFGISSIVNPFSQDPFTEITQSPASLGAFEDLFSQGPNFFPFGRPSGFTGRFEDSLIEDQLGRFQENPLGGGSIGPGGIGVPGTGAGGFGGTDGTGGTQLNPFDLVSNLTDLINPAINPGLSGAFAGIQSGQLGQLAGNELLFGEGGISSTLGEGLETGFKPDLQPVIDEASRQFFSEIVPQLGQSNVALQEGVGPFSSDLSGQLLNAGGTLASQLGALEVQNQNLAADRRGELLGLSPLLTDSIFNAGTNAGRNALDLGEQLALQGTTGGRQATLLQLLAGQVPTSAIQASASQNSSKNAGGGIL